MNKQDRAFIYGVALGDGHVRHRTRLKDGKYRYEQSELCLGHSPKQKEYLQWKNERLHSIFGGSPIKIREVFHKIGGSVYTGYQSSKTNKYFSQVHRNLYPTGKKVVTRKVLNFLNEESLAIWFMDDGSISANHNKLGKVTSVSLRISTQFTEEEADVVVLWMKEVFGIQTKKFLAKGKWDIGANTKESIKFASIVLPYIHPQLFYKLKNVVKLMIPKSAEHPDEVSVVGDDIVQSTRTYAQAGSVEG